MLVICMKDGVTSGGKVYREGDIFPMSEPMKQEFADLSADKLVKRQKRVYGEVLFRLPLPEELVKAYAEKRITLDQLGKEQRKPVAIAAKEAARQKTRAAEALAENLELDEVEEELIEKVEAKEEAAKEEAAPEPEPEKVTTSTKSKKK